MKLPETPPEMPEIPEEWKSALWAFVGTLDERFMQGDISDEAYKAGVQSAGLFTGWCMANNYTLIPPPELLDAKNFVTG